MEVRSFILPRQIKLHIEIKKVKYPQEETRNPEMFRKTHISLTHPGP